MTTALKSELQRLRELRNAALAWKKACREADVDQTFNAASRLDKLIALEEPKPKGKKLKLFVWENVLVDYTAGAMWALAYDAKHARELIIAAAGAPPSGVVRGDLESEPKVIEEPEGFCVWGGG